MDLFVFAAAGDGCGGLGPIVKVIKTLFGIIKIFVPIALLIFGVIDLAKAVMASDDKEIKSATTKFVKRAIAAVAVFFAFTLVDTVMGLIGKGDTGDGTDTDSTSWSKCWINS